MSKGKLPGITEAEFLKQVLEVAKLFGWRTFHARPGQSMRGWRTAVQGDGQGFVDVVLVKPGVGVKFWELKSDKGRLSESQGEWQRDLLAAGADCGVFWPADFDSIVEILRGKRKEGDK